MHLSRASLVLIPLLGLPLAARADEAPESERAALEYFETKVRPLLAENCYNCHSANTNAKGELRVDDRNGLIQGGASGPAVVPGDPEASLLIEAVRQTGDAPKMPPKKKLSPDQISILETWIKAGAVWPRATLAPIASKTSARYEALRKNHWAWQPVKTSQPPEVQDRSWPRSEIDTYVLSKLEEKGLHPVGDADKTTLLRRARFDLTGLPPTPEEQAEFLADPSPTAFESVVDRLLASPAFGERWGRHWLDVARYGESTGSSRNIPMPHSWRYRDYVIDSFNAGKPYDEFLREQIAGDLIEAADSRDSEENLVATGFLAVGVKDVNQRFKVRFVMDNVDEQIDAVSRAVLATTVSCARCHDHKFDPIPTSDYYALAGIFRSTDLCAGVRNKMGGGGLDYYDTQMLLSVGKPIASDPAVAEKVEKLKKSVATAKAEFEKLRDTPEGGELAPDGRPKRAVARQKFNRLQNELMALTDPANGGNVAYGVRDAKTVADTEIRIRGEAEKLGPVVPRGFPTLFTLPDVAKINPRQSGRLELAGWLTHPKNPLTSRVYVNRVWQHLFGRGIVASVDNFGTTGDVPTHPELLDHLAQSFVEDQWSVKRLVRRIVLSRTYRLDSVASPHELAVDPANRLLWRHAPRRLDAEEIHDATLLAAGRFDPSRPKTSISRGLKVIELPNNGDLARKIRDEAKESRHRGIYLPLLRGITPTSLEVFDFAEQGMVTGSRDTTTVATQALYLLNDPFVRRNALDLAESLLREEGSDDANRVDRAYHLALGRPASPDEIRNAAQFLADLEVTAREVIAANPPPEFPENVFAGRAREPYVASLEPTDTTGAGGAKKPAPPVNPDEVLLVDAPVADEVIRSSDARTEAWAGFIQALLGSAEFRYVR